MMVLPGYLLTVTLMTQAVTVASVETYCPPPVKRFLRINEKIYRKMNGAVIHINEVPQEEVVRLSLKPNPYYSSPKCGVLETKNGKGFSHFGVREEYDIQSFQKTGECQVYLAKPGLGEQSVELSLMVITDLVSGLSSECRPEVSVRVSLTVSLCAEEWSCRNNVTEAASETVTEDPANYEAEYVTNCESEWGCEPVADTEECPGEWGCVAGEETTLGPLIGEENEEEEDVVVVIYNTLMSPEMTPVTITILFIIGAILLISMWCLLCRKRTCPSSVKKPQRSLSMSSTMTSVASDRTISGPIPLIPDHEYIRRDNSDRNSSRSSQSLQEVKVSKDIKAKKRATSGSPEIERHYQNIDVIKTDNENVFIVPREASKKSLDKISERDPTEEGLESGEWCNNKTRPKTKHKRQQSRLSPTPSYSLENEEDHVDHSPQDSLGHKLPAVVANSYKIAQKDLPVTFY